MKLEIERKFLVASPRWREQATSAVHIRQGYLCAGRACTVRVRLAGDQAWLTIKGPGDGAARAEFEYPLPVADATALLEQVGQQPPIDKTRHRVPYGGLVFEVDVFHGANEGLVLAEVELDAADTHVNLPPWIGREVTGDHRYFNAYLALHPFRSWKGTGD